MRWVWPETPRSCSMQIFARKNNITDSRPIDVVSGMHWAFAGHLAKPNIIFLSMLYATCAREKNNNDILSKLHSELHSARTDSPNHILQKMSGGRPGAWA
jgi:hypothetical protein